jgi:hypothetical protein
MLRRCWRAGAASVPFEELVMTISRRVPSFLSALAFASVIAAGSLTPEVAHADVSARVADIASKGTIPPAVPVEAGLGFGMAAAMLAFGMSRRARR